MRIDDSIDQDLYFSIHKVLFACDMDNPTDPAQLETVKTLCEGKEECLIYFVKRFGKIECPGKGSCPFFIINIFLRVHIP